VGNKNKIMGQAGLDINERTYSKTSLIKKGLGSGLNGRVPA
jgi:hypothetical protein